METFKEVLFMVKDFLVAIKDAVVAVAGGTKTIATILANPESVLFVAVIVGFFFIMGGNKKWGCRITSGSVVGMFIMRLLEVM
ncbi:MAG: hypothetical protein ACRC1P_09920 [Cellulosilyticaceae bacterium]